MKRVLPRLEEEQHYSMISAAYSTAKKGPRKVPDAFIARIKVLRQIGQVRFDAEDLRRSDSREFVTHYRKN